MAAISPTRRTNVSFDALDSENLRQRQKLEDELISGGESVRPQVYPQLSHVGVRCLIQPPWAGVGPSNTRLAARGAEMPREGDWLGVRDDDLPLYDIANGPREYRPLIADHS